MPTKKKAVKKTAKPTVEAKPETPVDNLYDWVRRTLAEHMEDRRETLQQPEYYTQILEPAIGWLRGDLANINPERWARDHFAKFSAPDTHGLQESETERNRESALRVSEKIREWEPRTCRENGLPESLATMFDALANAIQDSPTASPPETFPARFATAYARARAEREFFIERRRG